MNTASEMAAGAVGGVVAGTFMTGVMTAGYKTGLIPEPLPLKVQRTLESRLGIKGRVRPKQEKLAALGQHYLLSAGLGAGYGLLHHKLHLSALPSGPIFGLGVYALMLGIIGPKIGATPGPAHEKKPEVARRIVMHLAFGAVTALVLERLERSGFGSPRTTGS